MCPNNTENKKMTQCDLLKTELYTKNIKISLLWHIPFYTLNKNTLSLDSDIQATTKHTFIYKTKHFLLAKYI